MLSPGLLMDWSGLVYLISLSIISLSYHTRRAIINESCLLYLFGRLKLVATTKITMDNKVQSDQDFDLDRDRDYIVQVAAYRRRDFDRAVININSEEHGSVRDSLAKPFDRVPAVTLGGLDSFPVDILHTIYSHLDIESLLKFRQTNQFAGQVVSNVPGYQVITTHALSPLCALHYSPCMVNTRGILSGAVDMRIDGLQGFDCSK